MIKHVKEKLEKLEVLFPGKVHYGFIGDWAI